ncbi:hypothetical protein DFW101_3486 [Solidesulfovibrio carbinoliphilus subsp. oakridgensis]|uniref:DUF7483 domain-containing protein n=1 Tax=Solidesulfovibrio carbinoliphilus subsp. oakridgensis TaxID=694327 RepID=G7QC38_9BACT|nr:hypothetical protein [Solidesulfovibrio carbinoliphilus]EHJ49484.1 hypothetical protein DFW101_3486 [Solidesulfovibrio carbinoliphilus subsp. oakridgensis]
MLATNLLAAVAGSQADKTYIEDVFSVDLYTGNGAAQTITNGIDLVTYGGLVWIKPRSDIGHHFLYDSARSWNNYLRTSLVDAQAFDTSLFFGGALANGFKTGTYWSGVKVVAWTFREAPKFFKMALITKSAGSNATVDLSSLGTVGMVRVKRIDAAGSWYVWHRSLPAGQLLIGETTAAAATLGHITVSGTTLTLVNGVIADGTYIIHAWAHDESPDGLVQAITFTTDSSGNAAVPFGFESQLDILKASTATGNWLVVDTMRGILTGSVDQQLYPNASTAETAGTTIDLTSNGLNATSLSASTTYVGLAIRRGPMRVPTDGTKVYNAIARTGTGAAATVTGVGFAPDIVIAKGKDIRGWFVGDRLRGAYKELETSSTMAEYADNSSWGGVTGFDTQDGARLGSDLDYGRVNQSSVQFVNYCFRRAPGFFDQVCYTGTGVARTIPHNLKSIPGMIWFKGRSAAYSWVVYHKSLGATRLAGRLEKTDAASTNSAWFNNTEPTDTVATVGASGPNDAGTTYVAYLFGDTPGLCKAFSYTGNGTNQDIPLGFIPRFIILKRTDASGDWYVFDTVRGIVSGNDPYLLLNSTAAEVTTTDFIDPIANGINASGSLININGAQMIGWACA